MGNQRARIFVSGVVQGVFFRATTRETADQIGGISGWVRNLPDGRVEALAEGDRAKLDRLIEWLRHGPPGARVDDLTVQWEPATGEHYGFRISR